MLGFWITVAAGATNVALDALFILVFKWGLVGSAVATAISQYVGAVVSVGYFASKNNSLLRLGKAYFHFGNFVKACSYGMSEFLSNVSMSVVAMLYNWQLLKYAGEDGVVAYGVLMYVCMIFLSCFIGYSVGTAPLVSYNYGAQNHEELKNIYKKRLVVVFASSAGMFVFSELCALPLSRIFVNYDANLLQMTTRAFQIFAFNFIFTGLPIFGSSFFTALNNGIVSALISFLRVALFQVVAVLVLPLIWQLDGIWISIVVAEALAFATAWIFLYFNQKRYGYGIKA
jgi:Na+-driven multidrug efflux pump